jgi:hypothetical protein
MTHHVQRLLVVCAVLITCAHSAAAQQATPPDTIGPRLLFSEVFPANSAIPGYVVLMEGVVYRAELEPGSATLSIRVARRSTLPPLFLTPISNEALPQGSSVYLMVPRSSEEYRLDVTVLGEEPVRVRIWSDPRESARWARIRAGGSRAPVFGAALHAVYMAVFRDAYASPYDSLAGYHTSPRAAYGLEGCLRVVPNGRLLPARVGGCALTLGLWFRDAGRDFYTAGIAPEIVVARAGVRTLAVSPQMSFGRSIGGKPTAEYVFLALGVRYSFPLVRRPVLGWEFEAAVVNARSLPGAFDPRRVSTVTLRLGAGLRLSP